MTDFSLMSSLASLMKEIFEEDGLRSDYSEILSLISEISSTLATAPADNLISKGDASEISKKFLRIGEITKDIPSLSEFSERAFKLADKFSGLYSGVFVDMYGSEDGAQQMVDGDAILCVSENYPCAACGTLTPWVSLSFQTHFCSRDCLNQWWEAYFKAEMEGIKYDDIN